ncbi:MAG: hypothetical protein H6742_00385 [Alphaproteobacteria bacterium]|nr:hypothetical protein [Alphaproteobacteria bacterium]
MLFLLAVLGCKSSEPFDLSGVWRFEVAVTANDVDACETRVLHNMSDVIEDSADEDPGDTGVGGWEEDAESTVSPSVHFGRFVRDGAAWLLFLDGETLPQEEGGDAANPTFAWEQSVDQHTEQTHPAGYRYAVDTTQSSVIRVQIGMPNDQQRTDAERNDTRVSLSGSWTKEDLAQVGYEESDLWAEELGLGESGQIPVGSYLTALDALGYVVPADNQRTSSDCNEDDCVLTVSSSCFQAFDLTATQTDIDPQDEGWADQGYEAGI